MTMYKISVMEAYLGDQIITGGNPEVPWSEIGNDTICEAIVLNSSAVLQTSYYRGEEVIGNVAEVALFNYLISTGKGSTLK